MEQTILSPLKVELDQIIPMKAVFDRNYVKKLDGTNVKKIKTKMDGAKMLMEDIELFKDEKKVDRLVAV